LQGAHAKRGCTDVGGSAVAPDFFADGCVCHDE
jgi:hypothetical protein